MFRRYRRRRFAPRRRRYGRKRMMRRRWRGSKYTLNRGVTRIRRSNQITIQGSDVYQPYIPSSIQAGVHVYQLDDLVNYTDFTNLFEEYRIVGVKHRFHLRRDPGANGSLSAGATFPTLYYSTTRTSYTGDLIPTSLNDMLEEANLQQRILEPGKPVTFYHKVYAADPVVGSTTTNSYSVLKSPWIPCGDGGIAAHYGLKYAIDELRNTSQFVDITNTYYLQFRGIK